MKGPPDPDRLAQEVSQKIGRFVKTEKKTLKNPLTKKKLKKKEKIDKPKKGIPTFFGTMGCKSILNNRPDHTDSLTFYLDKTGTRSSSHDGK